jgi:1,4-dihydroxy-2-naphthoyl-CoA synthase
MSDNPFHASAWRSVAETFAEFADLTDITYHRHVTDPTVRVAFNRAYAAEMPPLTLIACPVNLAAAALHKNTASAAISSAVGTPS